ncbi:NAD(P)/FAD-dependent oxidoreductase [Rhodopirellula sp. P2]|uniref:NAD(P)/FAD-dependent oxidoreductase n=1 Tax=Rhodopirellula sp. P2 TaxID=2127060 RepID=UPI0023686964|nr:NAD(P)/FAD-dependent oxidoreductase [Rhodopirellula sp. P2]WDQ18179.1 NAD(P)/FAD-dependent oxidoreductase [Rhodopirellula sp. P2]
MSDPESFTDRSFTETLIIGGGLAGLTCGRVLAEAGREFRILEATDRVGGRVRSDVVDGFTLDHGFQVLLTAYPACRRFLDYDALRLRPFEPGALIRQNGQFRVLGDPWRRPGQAIPSAMNPVGSLADKLRIAKLRRDSLRGSLQDLYERPALSTMDRLQAEGFSERIIDQFFRPFLGGVFLDESLSVSSRMLEFVFRMFARGEIAVPADGMAAIPRQLAESLPRGSVQFRTTVKSIESLAESERTAVGNELPAQARHRVVLSDGTAVMCRHLVIATPGSAAARLLGMKSIATPWFGTTNLYYAAEQSPDAHRLLMLRGDESGPIQSAVVLSDVAPSYAPPGKALVSISVDSDHEPADGLDDEALDSRVRSQLKDWFGEEAMQWSLLRVFRVPYSLPKMSLDTVVKSPAWEDWRRANLGDGNVSLPEMSSGAAPSADDSGAGQGRAGVWIAGDHCQTPSIQGAMDSGRIAAEHLLLNP